MLFNLDAAILGLLTLLTTPSLVSSAPNEINIKLYPNAGWVWVQHKIDISLNCIDLKTDIVKLQEYKINDGFTCLFYSETSCKPEKLFWQILGGVQETAHPDLANSAMSVQCRKSPNPSTISI